MIFRVDTNNTYGMLGGENAIQSIYCDSDNLAISNILSIGTLNLELGWMVSYTWRCRGLIDYKYSILIQYLFSVGFCWRIGYPCFCWNFWVYIRTSHIAEEEL